MTLVHLTGAWIAGLVAASLADLPVAVWAVWLVIPAGLLVLFRRDAVVRAWHIYLLVFIMAALRYTAALPHFDASSLASYNDRGTFALRGMVVAPPEVRDATSNIRLEVTELCTGDSCRAANGTALVQIPREVDVRYGDILQVIGTPRTPPEAADFSYKDYLERQGIHSLVRVYGGVEILERDAGQPFFAALYAFRSRAVATVHALFPEPAAALLAGILLGDDAGIPRDLTDAFRATNTAHIIAISGYNLAVLIGILGKLVRRLMNARRAVFVIIPVVALYTLLVGASPSVVRAALMAGMSLLGLYLGRPNDGLNALAFTALVMTVVDPFAVYDLSFLLSFSATLGLLLYADPISRGAERLLGRVVSGKRAKVIVSSLSDTVLVTVAAQITSTPLIVFAFHQLSLAGLLSNLLVLPVQPAVEIWGGLAVIIGMAVQPVGQVLAWVAWPFLEWTILAVEATAALPMSSVEVGRVDVLWLALYYALLFGATRVNWRGLNLASLRVKPRPALAIAAALVVGIWLWNIALAAPDGKMHVIFFDTEGAATLVRTPTGRRVLIDGGASPSSLLAAVGEQMPFWDRTIDVLVLTYPDDRHLAGLVPALERYEVGMIVQGRAPSKLDATYSRWRDLIAQKQVKVVPASAGLALVLDRDVMLELVYAGGTGSVVPRLRSGEMTFLFAQGVAEDEQAKLVRAGGGAASTVLLSPVPVVPEFTGAVQAQYIVIPTDVGSRVKPAFDTVASGVPVTVLDTGDRGTIEMVTDGHTLAVRMER